jgi:hypothetical protein
LAKVLQIANIKSSDHSLHWDQWKKFPGIWKLIEMVTFRKNDAPRGLTGFTPLWVHL